MNGQCPIETGLDVLDTFKFTGGVILIDIVALVGFFVLFRVAAYLALLWRAKEKAVA